MVDDNSSDTLALRSARARKAHWAQELQNAHAANDARKAAEALKFVSEYDTFIAELERIARATARS
jgi:hypothetical protein